MRNLEVILLYTKDFSVSEVASRSPETRMREDGTQAGRASPSGLLSLSHRSTTKGTLFHQTAGPWGVSVLRPTRNSTEGFGETVFSSSRCIIKRFTKDDQ